MEATDSCSAQGNRAGEGEWTVAKKRTKADKLQRSIDRTEKRTDARPEETIAKPKQDINQRLSKGC